MKKRMDRSPEEWNMLVEAFRSSDLKQRDFCKQRNISYGSFVRHLYNKGKRKPLSNGHAKANGFSQVGGPPAPEMIELQTKKGTIIRIPASASVSLIRNVLEATNEQ